MTCIMKQYDFSDYIILIKDFENNGYILIV